jgi:hypothetical protein
MIWLMGSKRSTSQILIPPLGLLPAQAKTTTTTTTTNNQQPTTTTQHPTQLPTPTRTNDGNPAPKAKQNAQNAFVFKEEPMVWGTSSFRTI